VCPDPECDALLIAFATRGEYVQHMRSVHGDTTLVDSSCPAAVEEPRGRSREECLELNRRFMRRLATVFANAPNVAKELSGHARGLIQGRITCPEFYAQFTRLCGERKNAVFTDMVAIMPDAAKRVQLLRLHENMGNRPTTQPAQQSRRGKKARWSPVALC
jgi:hypothetical protein